MRAAGTLGLQCACQTRRTLNEACLLADELAQQIHGERRQRRPGEAGLHHEPHEQRRQRLPARQAGWR